MYIMRVGKMNGVVQIGIDSNAKPERKAVPDQFPLGLELNHRQEGKENQNSHNPSGHPPFYGVGYVPLSPEEKVSLESEISHGEEEQDGDEFFDSKSKDYRADFCPHC